MSHKGSLSRFACLPANFLVEGMQDLWKIPSGTMGGLDFLRTSAILLVISGHYYLRYVEATGTALSVGKLPLFSFGWTGVDLFFVLSGYLIGRQLWRELADRNSIDVKRFLLRRGLRIWPFYYAFLVFTFSLSSGSAKAFLPDLLFLSNYMQHQVSGGWSLSTEEHFYIFVPLLLLALRRFIDLKRQYLVLLLLLVLLPLFRFLQLRGSGGIAGFDAVYFPFHTHSDGLVFGLLIAWCSVVTPSLVSGRAPLANILGVVPLLLAGSLLYFANKTLFAFSALALFYGAALLYMLRDRSVLQRFCRLRLFHLLSRLSYGMYLNHFPILLFGMPVVMPFVAKLGLGTNGFWLGGLVIVALSLLVSLTTFAFIESPFLRLRDRWLGQSVGAMPEGKFSMAATSSRGSRRGSEERGLTETAPP